MTPGKPISVYWYFIEDTCPDPSSNLGILDVEERHRYEVFKRPELAARFLFRRALLRKLLALHCDVPLSQLKLVAGPNGKPALADPDGKIHFNASHTDGFGVIAIGAQGPVGIDVEQIRPIDVAAFSQRILSPQERLEYSAIEESERLGAMFRYWTAKEAVIKAMGMGLNFNQLAQISISDESRTSNWRPVVFHSDFGAGDELQVKTLPMPDPVPETSIVSICCQQETEISFASAVEAVGE